MNGTMGAILINVLPFVVVLAVFYFLMIVPEKKRKKTYQTMIEELRVHDEIVTRGGIVGKITNIEEKSPRGRLGLVFGGGPLEATNLLRDAPDIPLTVSPVLEHRRRISYSTIGSYALFRQSKHKKETAEWLRFLTSPPVMARFCKTTSYVPAKHSVGSIYGDDPIFSVFEREAQYCRPDVKSVFARQVMMYVKPEMQAAALNRKTPRQALDDAARLVNEMLERGMK